MDTLEIFEKGRALPKDQIPFIPLKPVVLPFVIGKALGQPWPPPHRAAIYFLDDDIAIKLPTQQYIPDIAPGGPEKLLLTLSLGNFIFRDLERDNLDLINSQSSLSPNLARELRVGERNITFFERLTPLTAIWDDATEQQRKRWARELVSAVAFLESLGFVPNKTEVRDIGIDRTGRLKLVGYGTSPRLPLARDIADFEKAESEADYDGRLGLHPIEKFRRDVESAHQRVASCLHYILTGIDPDENMRSMTKEQLTELRILARKGEYPVAPGATAIADILQDAWALRTKTSFSELAKRVYEKLGGQGDEQDLPPPLSETYYQALEDRCREWVKNQELEPRWLEREEYQASCEAAGHGPM